MLDVFLSPSWQWIVSQIFMLGALVSVIIAMQIKEKSKALPVLVAFSAFYALGAGFLGNWVLVALSIVAVARNLVFLWRESKHPNNKALSYLTLFLFVASTLVASILTTDWTRYGISLVIAIMITIMASIWQYSVWQKNVHFMKIFLALYSAVLIINHVLYYNFVGLVLESVSIASVIFFYVMNYLIKKSKKTKPQDNADLVL